MNSEILNVTIKVIVPVMALFSIFLLLRGHNFPGGGFVGGLSGGAAVVLYAFSKGHARAQRRLMIHPLVFVSAGLLIAMVSGMFGLAEGLPFFTGIWADFYVPYVQKLGTPFLFDIGVYLVVFGVVVTIIFSMIDNF